MIQTLDACLAKGIHLGIVSGSDIVKVEEQVGKDLIEKWIELEKNKEVKAIIWSAQSVDSIQLFVEFLIKKMTIEQLEEFVKMKNLPEYILENYKKYFVKNKLYSNKDYNLKN